MAKSQIGSLNRQMKKLETQERELKAKQEKKREVEKIKKAITSRNGNKVWLQHLTTSSSSF